jgi:MoaA/NifB/PqqE/SkfB family radical SAM enzyme
MTAASLCTALKVPFVFNVTLHKLNVHQIETIGLLASELGASRLSYVMHCATGAPSDDDLFLPSREWRNVMDRIDRIAASLKLPVSVPEGYYREQPMHTCVALAGNQIHVDVRGRLNLCCQHSEVPDAGGNLDIAGDLNEMSLADAYENFLKIVHRYQVDKMRALSRGELTSEWDHFPCNYCMKYHGKPYWADEGAAGPGARRERKFPPRASRLPVIG